MDIPFDAMTVFILPGLGAVVEAKRKRNMLNVRLFFPLV